MTTSAEANKMLCLSSFTITSCPGLKYGSDCVGGGGGEAVPGSVLIFTMLGGKESVMGSALILVVLEACLL